MLRRFLPALLLPMPLYFLHCVGDAPQVPSGDGPDATTSPTPTTTATGTGTVPPNDKKATGISCGGATECATGFCVDGVCCESACTGTCEKCNQSGSVGKCEAIGDGQDPDNECPTTPLPDAGTTTVDDAGADGGDAGTTLNNIPDGGIVANDTNCAGKCNGKRACAYPTGTGCGSQFCTTTTSQARSACDGQGHCLVGVEACSAYSCKGADGGLGAGCNTQCLGPNDCLPTHYCDTNKQCQPKLPNAGTCASGLQCQSGICYGGPPGVCCNDACNITGGSCTNPGKEGQCVCSACPGGTCKLWYRDLDKDGYGDKAGTVANKGAIVGCASMADGGPLVAPTDGTQPGVTFVENNTDCFDDTVAAAANVHPGQTAYFTSGYGVGNTNFDYDCSGAVEKETYELIGGNCGFCTGCPSTPVSTCTTANQSSFMSCTPIFVGGLPGGGTKCLGRDQYFYTTVACGATSSVKDCTPCTVAGGTAGTTFISKQQKCR